MEFYEPLFSKTWWSAIPSSTARTICERNLFHTILSKSLGAEFVWVVNCLAWKLDETLEVDGGRHSTSCSVPLGYAPANVERTAFAGAGAAPKPKEVIGGLLAY